MSVDEVFAKLDDLLSLHFPDEPTPNGPYWRQSPYLDDLFDLSMQAYGLAGRDDVSSHVRSRWKIHRRYALPPDVERKIGELVDAWGDWQFARQKLSKGE